MLLLEKESVQITDGVFLAKAIFKVNINNKAFTTILSTNNHVTKIDRIYATLEPFTMSSANILNVESTDYCQLNDKPIKLLKENLRLVHLNLKESKSVLDPCIQFNEIFYLPNDVLTCTKSIRHEINVTDKTPIHSKIYRFPEVHKHEISKQIDKMLKQGIIRPSISLYSSPLCVVKKNLTHRVKRNGVLSLAKESVMMLQ